MLKVCQILAVLMLVLNPSGVFACSVGPDYEQPTISQRVAGASYIVEGTAEEIKDELAERYGRAARVTVKRWLKGNGPSQVIIYNFGWGPDCRSPVPIVRSVFFATQLAPSKFVLHYKGVQDAVISATHENITEVIKALQTQ